MGAIFMIFNQTYRTYLRNYSSIYNFRNNYFPTHDSPEEYSSSSSDDLEEIPQSGRYVFSLGELSSGNEIIDNAKWTNFSIPYEKPPPFREGMNRIF
jgi:hypothetical protein